MKKTGEIFRRLRERHPAAKKNLLLAAAAILASGALFFLIISGQGQSQSKSKEAPSQPAAGHEGHTMGAGETKPQSAPKGGETAQEAPTIEIPAEKLQMIGVKTSQVSLQPLQRTIRTVGIIEYDEKRLATVNTKFEGWIEKLHVDYTGKFVRKGDPLAEIYSPELLATQREFINLLKWRARPGAGEKKSEIDTMLSRDAESIVEAARQRLHLWDISDSQIKKIEETGKPIRTLTVYSPASGYVVQKAALQGMRVMPGEKLFDIADLSTVWIISDVYEYELSVIKEGQTATISLSNIPGKEFTSKIDYVYPALSGETRTAKVRFSVPNPGGRLKPQMYTDVLVKITLGKRLAIPKDSIIDTGTRQIVYVDKGEGLFEPREVMLGLRGDDMVEVLQGLKSGDKVASSATFLIDSEAKLKGVVPLHQH